MPDKEKLKLILKNNPRDLKNIRIPGADKPLEAMTIGELMQLRPGGELADSWNVTAVTDNATVSSSSLIADLNKIRPTEAFRLANRLRGMPNVELDID